MKLFIYIFLGKKCLQNKNKYLTKIRKDLFYLITEKSIGINTLSTVFYSNLVGIIEFSL